MLPRNLTLFVRKDGQAMFGWDEQSNAYAKRWAEEESKCLQREIMANDAISEIQIVSIFAGEAGAIAQIKIPGKPWVVNVPASSIFKLAYEVGIQKGGSLKGNFVWVIQNTPILMDVNTHRYQDLVDSGNSFGAS